MKPDRFVIPTHIRQAVAAGRPVVALESTIIAHGMPYPENVRTAAAVEQIVREGSAVPATIGVVSGRVTVGLTSEEIEIFATSDSVGKAGERDLPVAVARGEHAATTAGATMAIAAAAGISVFVTGGIGGVGPTASQDFDISADLLALAHYRVITVCAGAKAFMDIAATLELLETLRVPVGTWRTDEYPLFYSLRSGHASPWVVNSAEEIAAAFQAKLDLGMDGGILIAVPVPEAEALPDKEAIAAAKAALAAIRERGITGKRVTPFLLSQIATETRGRSLAANQALIRNNAKLGAAIAVALAEHA
ncbi:MAG: pseudouridine-5'-phosphate glycosidase [Acidobacteria bacterium]|nr:pseudouridine-5'-phosphate glycosidase [Acidobacteriota bacterium]